MAEDIIEVAALNIVASPHPDGIYRRVLAEISDNEIPLWGSDWAKITAPKPFEARKNLYYGEILIWAKIDTEGKWLNTDKNVEATEEEKQKAVEALPDNLEPNFRPFTYVFDEAQHLLVIEVRNGLGQRLSPKRAERMFLRLFETLSTEWPEMDVTVVPEEETLDRIFALPQLRKLEIFIKKPNPDDVGDDFHRIMASLEAEGARSWKTEKVKSAKAKSLIPSNETKLIAFVGATNGYVAAEGKDEIGNAVAISTDEHPKIRKIEVTTSTFGAIVGALRYFRNSVAKPD